MTQFSELGLAEPLISALKKADHFEATPIQAKAIPVLTEGRDMMGLAQTGTGKTAAFVLPILQDLALRPEKTKAKSCRALILAPTRELAGQIADNVRLYGRNLRPRVALVVGGVKGGPQAKVMERGVDILIATPGRLEDHMKTGAITLKHTEIVVLDEADQMLDLGFIHAMRRIVARAPEDRQTVMLSATMPDAIDKLAKEFLADPVLVKTAPAGRPIDRIKQSVRIMPVGQKRDALVEILSAPDADRAIVFTRTKRGADRVTRHLEGAGLTAEAIHGNKSQGQRTRALKGFKSGKVSVLVATDIAARGIDIDDVSHVVNFDLPDVPESYVHRIGRTARAGKDGVAISLCAPDERGQLRDIEKLTGVAFDLDDEAKALLKSSGNDNGPAARKQGRRSGGRPQQNGPKRSGGKPHRKGRSGPDSRTKAHAGRKRKPGSRQRHDRPKKAA